MVVLEELSLALRRLVLHTNAHLGPRRIETRLQEALEKAMMNMRNIRRSSIAIQGSNEDGLRIQLLRLCEDHLLPEGRFHSLGQLPELRDVDVLADLGCSEIHDSLRGTRDEAKGPTIAEGAGV